MLLPVDFPYPAFALLIFGNGVGSGLFAAPNTADKSRKFFDDMNEWARGEGYAGLGIPYMPHIAPTKRW